MTDIPHAHNTRRSLGYTSAIVRPRKLHWLSERTRVACGLAMQTLDFTKDPVEWSGAGLRCCKKCAQRMPEH